MGKRLAISVAAAIIFAVCCEAEAQTTWAPSGSARQALDSLKMEAEAGNRAADAIHAKDRTWSGSAPRSQAGDLQTGQNLDYAVRSAIAAICHDVAHTKVL